MTEGDVPPEHQPAVIRLEHVANAIEVLEIDCPYAARLCCFPALAFSELKRLVSADVEKLAREKCVQLTIPISDQLERLFLLRRKDVAVGHFRQLVILLKLERLVQMSEGLLFWNELDVIPARVGH